MTIHLLFLLFQALLLAWIPPSKCNSSTTHFFQKKIVINIKYDSLLGEDRHSDFKSLEDHHSKFKSLVLIFLTS